MDVLTNLSIKPKKIKDIYLDKIIKVVLYIDKHLEKDFTLDELARVALFSKYHFHRIFTEIIGESTAQYIRRVRLNKAFNILFFNNIPINEIAAKSNFQSNESFTRAFKKYFNILPSQLRNKKKVTAVEKTIEENNKLFADLVVKNTFGLHPDTTIINKPIICHENVAPIHILFYPSIGQYLHENKVWQKLYACAYNNNIAVVANKMITILQSEQIFKKTFVNFRIDIALPILSKPTININNYKLFTGGEYVTFIHTGSKEQLYATINWLVNFYLPQNNKTLRAAEIFFTCDDIENQNVLQRTTKVFIPV